MRTNLFERYFLWGVATRIPAYTVDEIDSSGMQLSLNAGDFESYSSILQELDSGMKKCVSIGAITICSARIKILPVNF